MRKSRPRTHLPQSGPKATADLRPPTVSRVPARGRSRYLLGAIACTTVLAGGVVWLVAPTTVPAKPYALPRIELPDLQTGRSVRLGNVRERPFVINFFFSDCAACVVELPRIEAAAKKWAGRIDVIGIDHFERRAEGLAFVSARGITFPVAWDEKGIFAPQVGVTAFPATLFVDRNGIVRKRFLGEISVSRLNRELEALFTIFHDK